MVPLKGLMLTCDWVRVISCASADGMTWATAYKRHEGLVEGGKRSLQCMREGRRSEGKAHLDKLRDEIAGLADETPSLLAVLSRYLYGAEAYYYYCIQDYAGAHRSMHSAHTAIVNAVTAFDQLLMLSVDCQEFQLHHAKIARKEGRVVEMQKHLDRARAMLSDHVPLCTTTDGREICWSTIRTFLDGISTLSLSEAHEVQKFTQPAERRALFDLYVRQMLGTGRDCRLIP
jgi:hypothetical protein